MYLEYLDFYNYDGDGSGTLIQSLVQDGGVADGKHR